MLAMLPGIVTWTTKTMINLLVGRPGGGKSFEAVAYHVLPALMQGRKVITNLPLNVDAFARIDASFESLIDLRHENYKEEVFNQFGVKETLLVRPFASMRDYADPWRHSVSGAGPLYVIDECHLSLPRGNTRIEVEEWFSLHRHETADVLLIAQSYGKVSRNIIEMVQTCYKVSKNVALGFSSNYTRKVLDGVRGEEVNSSVRKYDKQYFPLYKSHTQGGGSEQAASDIKPIWQHWSFYGVGLMLVLGIYLFSAGKASLNPFGSATEKMKVGKPIDYKALSEPTSQPVSQPVRLSDGSVLEPYVPVPLDAVQPVPDSAIHPLSNVDLHVVSRVQFSSGRGGYGFVVSQNGQPIFHVSQSELEEMGYTVVALSNCSVRVTYGDFSEFVICDSPQVGADPGGNINMQGGSPERAQERARTADPAQVVGTSDGTSSVSNWVSM